MPLTFQTNTTIFKTCSASQQQNSLIQDSVFFRALPPTAGPSEQQQQLLFLETV